MFNSATSSDFDEYFSAFSAWKLQSGLREKDSANSGVSIRNFNVNEEEKSIFAQMEKLWIKKLKNINNLSPTENVISLFLIKKYINKKYFILAIVEPSL